MTEEFKLKYTNIFINKFIENIYKIASKDNYHPHYEYYFINGLNNNIFNNVFNNYSPFPISLAITRKYNNIETELNVFFFNHRDKINFDNLEEFLLSNKDIIFESNLLNHYFYDTKFIRDNLFEGQPQNDFNKEIDTIFKVKVIEYKK